MITLHLEKLYRYPRIEEHMSVAVPFGEGQLTDLDKVRVWDGERALPVQCKATARYADGSIKYLFVRFRGDLPGNAGKDFLLDPEGTKEAPGNAAVFAGLRVMQLENGLRVENGEAYFIVRNGSAGVFENYFDGRVFYGAAQFAGPCLDVYDGTDTFAGKEAEAVALGNYQSNCQSSFTSWSVEEQGPLCVILKAIGLHSRKGAEGSAEGTGKLAFEVWVTAWAGKPWVEITYRLINTSSEELKIKKLGFYFKVADGKEAGENRADREENDTTVTFPRYCTGISGYKTKFTFGEGNQGVSDVITAERLLMENNEHMAEVLYGTFFVDRTDRESGLCATIYQAQQNYPKAVSADPKGLAVMLVPEGEDKVVLQPGMSRSQRFLLHFHGAEEEIQELNNRSLIYQMPDRPSIEPRVFQEAGVMSDVFPKNRLPETELVLCRRADSHNRGFGMLNWGDSIDKNYTNQGRGGGKVVWTNNEYDYPHACALMYARTGTRRFLDYMLVSALHWMDVDICHYSEEPLRVGAQIEHTKGHVIGGKVVPSHQWVEGLLDYYHFTGDERGLRSAIGIGENIRKLLDTPAFSKAGELSARETGWALRTLTALYVETGDEKWLEKGQWIVNHFKQWEEEYGHWLSPYTDNTLIRVPFMIAVAVGSLMRYYRVRPDEELRGMMLRAIDDMVENCILETGLFYYKELPSLQRNMDNPLPLEALAVGYELTGDKKYLEAGLMTFRRILRENVSGGGQRLHIDDAVILPGEGTKLFGQGFLPLAVFDKALETAGMRERL